MTFSITPVIDASKTEIKYKTDEFHQTYVLRIVRYSIITRRQSAAILHISRLRILPCSKGRTLPTPCGSVMKYPPLPSANRLDCLRGPSQNFGDIIPAGVGSRPFVITKKAAGSSVLAAFV
jgi:hypothetical protein